MREIYRQNPAYHEFRLNDRNDLVDLLKHGESYIISLSNKSLGIVGTVRFDAFKDEKFANRHILTFKRKNIDENGNILSQDSVNVDILNIEDAKKFLFEL